MPDPLLNGQIHEARTPVDIAKRVRTPEIQKLFRPESRTPGAWNAEQQLLEQNLGLLGPILASHVTPEARRSKYLTRVDAHLMAAGFLPPNTPGFDLARRAMTELIIAERPDVVLWTLKAFYPGEQSIQTLTKGSEFAVALSQGTVTLPADYREKVNILVQFDEYEAAGDASQPNRKQTPLFPIVSEVAKIVKEIAPQKVEEPKVVEREAIPIPATIQEAAGLPRLITPEELQLLLPEPEPANDQIVSRRNERYFKGSARDEQEKRLMLAIATTNVVDFLGAGVANIVVRLDADRVARVKCNAGGTTMSKEWAKNPLLIEAICNSYPALQTYLPHIYAMGSTSVEDVIKISRLTEEQLTSKFGGIEARYAVTQKPQPFHPALTISPEESFSNPNDDPKRRNVLIVENLSPEKGWVRKDLGDILGEKENTPHGAENALKMIQMVLEMQSTLMENGVYLHDFKGSFAMKFDSEGRLTQMKVMDIDQLERFDPNHKDKQRKAVFLTMSALFDNLWSDTNSQWPPTVNPLTFLKLPDRLQDPHVTPEQKNQYAQLAKIAYEFQSSWYPDGIAKKFNLPKYTVAEILSHIKEGRAVSMSEFSAMNDKINEIFQYEKNEDDSIHLCKRPNPDDTDLNQYRGRSADFEEFSTFFDTYFPHIKNRSTHFSFRDVAPMLEALKTPSGTEEQNLVSILQAYTTLSETMKEKGQYIDYYILEAASIFLSASGKFGELRINNIQRLATFKKLVEEHGGTTPVCVDAAIRAYLDAQKAVPPPLPKSDSPSKPSESKPDLSTAGWQSLLPTDVPPANYDSFKYNKRLEIKTAPTTEWPKLAVPETVAKQVHILGAGVANVVFRIDADTVARVRCKKDEEWWAANTVYIAQLCKENPALQAFFPRVQAIGSTAVDTVAKLSGLTLPQLAGKRGGMEIRDLIKPPEDGVLTVDPNIAPFTEPGKSIDRRTVLVLENLSAEKGWVQKDLQDVLKPDKNNPHAAENALKMIRMVLDMQTMLLKNGVVLFDFKKSFAMKFDADGRLSDLKIMDMDQLQVINPESSDDRRTASYYTLASLFEEEMAKESIPPQVNPIDFLHIPTFLPKVDLSKDERNAYLQLAKVLYELQSAQFSSGIARKFGLPQYTLEEIVHHTNTQDNRSEATIVIDVLSQNRKLTEVDQYSMNERGSKSQFDRRDPDETKIKDIFSREDFLEKYFPELKKPKDFVFSDPASYWDKVTEAMSTVQGIAAKNVIELLEAYKVVYMKTHSVAVKPPEADIYLTATGQYGELRLKNVQRLALFKKEIEENGGTTPLCVNAALQAFLAAPETPAAEQLSVPSVLPPTREDSAVLGKSTSVAELPPQKAPFHIPSVNPPIKEDFAARLKAADQFGRVDFIGLEGAQTAELPELKYIEPVNTRGQNLATSLDTFLGNDQVNAIMTTVNKVAPTLAEFTGSTSYVNHAVMHLPYDVQPGLMQKLKTARGRVVGVNLLIKIAKKDQYPYSSRNTYNEYLRRDAYASRLPGIAPFACLVSEPRMLATGQLAMVVEQSVAGYDIDDDRVTAEDRKRIFFQILSIGQAHHNAGMRAVDFAKNHMLYQKDDLSPRRIKLFDFGIGGYLPTQEPERSKERMENLAEEADMLKDSYLRLIPPSEQPYIKKLLEDMKNGVYKSFAEVAAVVDTDGALRKELVEIEKQCTYTTPSAGP